MRSVLIATRWACQNAVMSEQTSPPHRGRLRERAAEELRVVLARKRMSGSELARRTGMKQPYLSRRMTGEIAFDLDDLEVIASALGIKVQDLIAGPGSSPGSKPMTAKVTQAVRRMASRPKVPVSTSNDQPTTRRPVRVGKGALLPPSPFVPMACAA